MSFLTSTRLSPMSNDQRSDWLQLGNTLPCLSQGSWHRTRPSSIVEEPERQSRQYTHRESLHVGWNQGANIRVELIIVRVLMIPDLVKLHDLEMGDKKVEKRTSPRTLF